LELVKEIKTLLKENQRLRHAAGANWGTRRYPTVERLAGQTREPGGFRRKRAG